MLSDEWRPVMVKWTWPWGNVIGSTLSPVLLVQYGKKPKGYGQWKITHIYRGIVCSHGFSESMRRRPVTHSQGYDMCFFCTWGNLLPSSSSVESFPSCRTDGFTSFVALVFSDLISSHWIVIYLFSSWLTSVLQSIQHSSFICKHLNTLTWYRFSF